MAVLVVAVLVVAVLVVAVLVVAVLVVAVLVVAVLVVAVLVVAVLVVAVLVVAVLVVAVLVVAVLVVAVLVVAVLVVAVLVVAVLTGGILLFRDEPLPIRGDGAIWPETTGSLGAKTSADPVTMQDNAQPIPPDTTVQVRCRFHAPSVPSVEPDGFWYLIDSGEWAGRWSPANSFMNGDHPGRPTVNNTDMVVPVCH